MVEPPKAQPEAPQASQVWGPDTFLFSERGERNENESFGLNPLAGVCLPLAPGSIFRPIHMLMQVRG